MKPLFELPELLTLDGDAFSVEAENGLTHGIACSLGCITGCCSGCFQGSGSGPNPFDPIG
jgi:hypothetical protein